MAMRIPFAGLTGPVLAFANKVQQAFDQLTSVRLTIVATDADLPTAEQWQGRQIIIRDTKIVATAIDGAWYDPTGSAL